MTRGLTPSPGVPAEQVVASLTEILSNTLRSMTVPDEGLLARRQVRHATCQDTPMA